MGPVITFLRDLPFFDTLLAELPEIAKGIATLLVGVLIAQWRGWYGFRGRAFFDRMTVSLNYVHDDRLYVRTLIERNAADVFRNAEMFRTVMNAARKGKGVLLDLPDADYWYYLNAVLNVVSEHFASGYLSQESGAPVVERRYLLFLTCERQEKVRQRKVRAMMVREDLLLATDALLPKFHNEFATARWNTLRAVREEWVRSGGNTPRIREIILCV